ncbi:hypothetical protein vBEcoMRo157lw_00084 [Escherichia phage vB_EcoM-Ro157lw]|uniref:Uncharacterized protein n=1 Tax=Escherichia phage vB_EcoM-Ro157lw TaxID=2144177 RepID=A0A494RDK9_9CAUD|nr:hypothetical protein vBEcoMRo157lw_00084 [Escherichia phage vB_EcoM-Ro157lw]
MIIHRPLMLNREECEEILHALRRAEADVNIRVKVRNFIMNEFKSDDVGYAIDELLKRNVKGATRPIHHQSRCVRVPIQTYVDKKPRLKPIDIFDIKNGDSIISKDAEEGAIPINGRVIYVSHDADQTLIQWVRFDKTAGGKYRYYGDERFTTKFYKVLDHGSC